METTEKKQRPIDIRRAALIALSVKARKYKDEMASQAQDETELMYWATQRVNDIIAKWYREQTGAREFKTFAQWHEAGCFVKKGAKAFVLWGRKRKNNEGKKGKHPDPQETEYEFYPLAYLFSDQQVEPAK